MAIGEPLSYRLLAMTDDMPCPSPMHIKYVSYVHDRICIGRTYFPGPNESVIWPVCKVSAIQCEHFTKGIA